MRLLFYFVLLSIICFLTSCQNKSCSEKFHQIKEAIEIKENSIEVRLEEIRTKKIENISEKMLDSLTIDVEHLEVQYNNMDSLLQCGISSILRIAEGIKNDDYRQAKIRKIKREQYILTEEIIEEKENVAKYKEQIIRSRKKNDSISSITR